MEDYKENKKPNRKCVLMSIKKRHLENIISGRKSIELRKSYPTILLRPFDIFFYESGGDGRRKIVATASCTSVQILTAYDNIMRLKQVAIDACVGTGEVVDYMQDGELYLLGILGAVELTNYVSLSTIGLAGPPQSWQYLSEEQEKEINKLTGM